MMRLLQKLGHNVQPATSVKAAISILARDPIDLLISDLGLPDGSGYDLMRAARQRSRLKGIAVSGYGMETDVALSKEVGFEAHLTKPLDFHQIDVAITQIMSSDDGDHRRAV